MFGILDYGAFVVAIIIFLLIPGPGNLALAISTGKSGFRAGMAVTLGVILGDQVLLWLAVAGVAALLSTHPSAFLLVRTLGAVYLLWLGYQMLRAKAGSPPALTMRPTHYVWQGFVITLFNPKAILFYMAFFPQFVDPKQHLGLQTFGFMALTIAALTLLYGLCAVSITFFAAKQLKQQPKIGRFFEKVAGLFLIGFGVKLALGR